jgi:uncharacterized linocin/CFP29 family protein
MAVTDCLFFVPSADFLGGLLTPPTEACPDRRLPGHRQPERSVNAMTTPAATNNLHRGLALTTSAAWARIEKGVRHASRRRMADRRVLDVCYPAGPGLAAGGTGHVSEIAPPTPGVAARLCEAKPLVELRVPFTVSSTVGDDVERGSHDVDQQPVQGAAHATAHDADSVELYDHETLTFLTYTDQAVVVQEVSDVP